MTCVNSNYPIPNTKDKKERVLTDTYQVYVLQPRSTYCVVNAEPNCQIIVLIS